jgi:GDP-L-fucose synthase
MTYLVTGGTGLVGSSVLRLLSQLDLPVKGVSSKDADLCDRDQTFQLISDTRPKFLIMAAAKVGGIVANQNNPVGFLSENLQIQTNLLDAAHEFKIEKVVFLGSSCIYPRDSNQPILEESLMTGPLEFTNAPYALAKLSGLHLVQSYRRQFGHSWISLMPTNLYGPNDNFDLVSSHVLPALLRKFHEALVSDQSTVTLWGTGAATREFLHVDDLSNAILHCLKNYNDDLPLNVGTGVETSVKDLAMHIAQIVGYRGQIEWDKSKPDGTPRKVLDVKRITNLGWRHEIDLLPGIEQTYKWFKESQVESSS